MPRKLYHPFIYRLLFKSLQYTIQVRASKKPDLTKDPSVSELEKWSGICDELGEKLSRNTLIKLMGTPSSDQESSQITDRTLNLVAKNVVKYWSEKSHETLREVELNGGVEFQHFLSIIEFLESTPEELTDLKKHEYYLYYKNLSKDEQNSIDQIVDMTIRFNFGGKETQTEILDSLEKKPIAYRKGSIQEYYKRKDKINKEKLRFGVFPCQDTILPLYFESAYNLRLNVEFVQFDSWGEGLEAFKKNKIDIALHNFSTALAACESEAEFTPSFFYPLFSFSGYGLFLKQGYIRKKIEELELSAEGGVYFSELPPPVQKQILKGAEVIVEAGTDFEWAVERFMQGEHGLSNQKNDYTLTNTNTNEGKQKYKKLGDMYCTNPIHMLDIMGSKKIGDEIELVFEGGNFNHENFNGIISTFEYANQNSKAIAEVIYVWFRTITFFKKIIDKYVSSKKIIGNKVIYSAIKEESILAKAAADFLNNYTGSNVEAKFLMDMFAQYNTFYDSPEESFGTFYSKSHLFDEDIKNTYIRMAELQLIDIGENTEKNFEISLKKIITHSNMFK